MKWNKDDVKITPEEEEIIKSGRLPGRSDGIDRREVIAEVLDEILEKGDPALDAFRDRVMRSSSGEEEYHHGRARKMDTEPG